MPERRLPTDYWKIICTFSAVSGALLQGWNDYMVYEANHPSASSPTGSGGGGLMSPSSISLIASSLIVVGLVAFAIISRRTAKIPEEMQTQELPATHGPNEQQKTIRAGALYYSMVEAAALRDMLEAVWHDYNNDRRGQPLLYPLSASEIPDEIKEWKHKQLWRFRVLYRWHITVLRGAAPDFHSSVVDGLPENSPYLSLLNNLKIHLALLQKRADSLAPASSADAKGEH